VLWPSLNRPERGGGAVPRRQWPLVVIGLDVNQGGEIKGGNGRD
jgi:hypothetical protein